MNIPLDEEKGLNPIITICPICYEQTEEIALAGNSDIYECNNCHEKIISYPGKKIECKCGNIKTILSPDNFKLLRKFDTEKDEVYSQQPCDKCKKILEEQEEQIKNGGIYFRCKNCGSNGVIKAGETTSNIRKQLNRKEFEIFGIEYNTCYNCSNKMR